MGRDEGGCADAIRVIRDISGSLKYTLILVVLTTIFCLSTDFTDFTDFGYASVVFLPMGGIDTFILY